MDLDPLLPKEKRRLPSTTINAFGAHLQKVLDVDQGVGDTLIIFSSWLGPIATGEIKDGGFKGSFKDHVIAAVRHMHQ